MGKKPLPLRIDEGLLERVDAARGDVSRTRFVERALEAAVEFEGRLPVPPGESISMPAAKVWPDPAETVVLREGDPEHAGQRHPGLGRCPKATCSQMGLVGGTCPDHRNLRFKA